MSAWIGQYLLLVKISCLPIHIASRSHMSRTTKCCAMRFASVCASTRGTHPYQYGGRPRATHCKMLLQWRKSLPIHCTMPLTSRYYVYTVECMRSMLRHCKFSVRCSRSAEKCSTAISYACCFRALYRTGHGICDTISPLRSKFESAYEVIPCFRSV